MKHFWNLFVCGNIGWLGLGFWGFLMVSLSRRSGSRYWRTVVLGRTCHWKNFSEWILLYHAVL